MQNLEVNNMTDRVSYKDIVDLISNNNKTINENIIELARKIDALHNKLDAVDTKVNDVKLQATRTNGRVTNLELYHKDNCVRIEKIEKINSAQQSWIDSTKGKVAVIGVIALNLIYIIIEIFKGKLI